MYLPLSLNDSGNLRQPYSSHVTGELLTKGDWRKVEPVVMVWTTL